MNLTAMLRELEEAEMVPPPWPKHPVMSPDARAIWTRSSGAFWLVLESHEGEWWPRLECEGPVPGWFEWVSEEFMSYLFPDASHDEELVASEMMRLGIAPDQPFKVLMSFQSYGPDLWGDYDTEVDWEVGQVEALSPEEALRRWEAWWKARVDGFLEG